jgi:hypothetical protein
MYLSEGDFCCALHLWRQSPLLFVVIDCNACATSAPTISHGTPTRSHAPKCIGCSTRSQSVHHLISSRYLDWVFFTYSYIRKSGCHTGTPCCGMQLHICSRLCPRSATSKSHRPRSSGRARYHRCSCRPPQHIVTGVAGRCDQTGSLLSCPYQLLCTGQHMPLTPAYAKTCWLS